MVLSNHLFAQTKKILWLGNSYVSVNDLPLMFHDLALSNGDTVIYDVYAPGGYTLQQHSADATAIQKIYSQQWDYVIVQAQSQEPSFAPAQVEQQTFPYARVLDSLITDNDSCTETVFYMTWGKKYGDQQNCASYPAICTFEGVAQRLRASYLQMADDNHAITAPVGMAWYASWHTDTLINLWQADNSHPTVAGSYLAACVFYGALFQKTPVGILYSPISAQTTNTYLQTIAHNTVFDSLLTWHIGSYSPHAGFSFTGDEATRTYTFSPQNATNYTSLQWSFGDNTTSTTSGTHTYADTGTYLVQLVVYNECGESDTVRQSLTIGVATGEADTEQEAFTVYPNPVSSGTENNFVRINCSTGFLKKHISLFDINGRSVYSSIIKTSPVMIDISGLAKGVYLLKAGNSHTKIVVE